jgi:hypothetical protein
VPLFDAAGMEELERVGIGSETGQRCVRGAIFQIFLTNISEAFNSAGCVHVFIREHRQDIPIDLRLISAITQSASLNAVLWVLNTITTYDAPLPPWPVDSPILNLPRDVRTAWHVISKLEKNSPSWNYIIQDVDREFTEAFLREILRVLTCDATRLVPGMAIVDEYLKPFGWLCGYLLMLRTVLPNCGVAIPLDNDFLSNLTPQQSQLFGEGFGVVFDYGLVLTLLSLDEISTMLSHGMIPGE